MNKYNIILVLSLMISSTIYGQTKFEKGYLVTDTGRVIDCLIKNERWLSSPKEIVYKLSETSSEIIADAIKIKEFRVENGPLFIAHTGNFPIYKGRVASQNSNREIKTIQRSAFLEQIHKGEATLYKFREGNDTSFAFRINDGPITVLLYGESVGENNRINHNNQFRNQLYKEVNCGNNQNIQELIYSLKPLENYFANFNKCINPEGELEEQIIIEKSNSKLSFILWAGVQRYDFGIVTTSRILDYNKTITPKIGIELENIFPFNNNKWALFLSAAYTSHKSEAIVTNIAGMELLAGEFELNRVETALAARHYMFLNDKSSLFLEGGTAFDFDFNTNITGAELPENRLNAAKANFAAFLGVGYSHNQKLYSRLDYYFDQNILTFLASYNNALSRLSLTLGYKL